MTASPEEMPGGLGEFGVDGALPMPPELICRAMKMISARISSAVVPSGPCCVRPAGCAAMCSSLRHDLTCRSAIVMLPPEAAYDDGGMTVISAGTEGGVDIAQVRFDAYAPPCVTRPAPEQRRQIEPRKPNASLLVRKCPRKPGSRSSIVVNSGNAGRGEHSRPIHPAGGDVDVLRKLVRWADNPVIRSRELRTTVSISPRCFANTPTISDRLV